MPERLLRFRGGLVPALAALAAGSCAGEPPQGPVPTDEAAPESSSPQPGALIQMGRDGAVGVLLDEIPAGPMRDAAAAEALAQSAAFWKDRAARQTRLTQYRLMYRRMFHEDPKGPLPLPAQREIWDIQILGAPRRERRG